MENPSTSLLTSTDWNEEWKRLQEARRKSDDPATWDERAKTFPVKHGSQSGYVSRFIELAGIGAGETVFDMGCGTGALAIPLAMRGCRVIACDFSEGMLAALREDQGRVGAAGIETHLLSWDDDWQEKGVCAPCADVALASRSIATYDLQAALVKLDRIARRRVCITLPCGSTPKADNTLLARAGFAGRMGRDFQYAFNILAGLGICPEVAYIASRRSETFASREAALEAYSRIVDDAVRGLAGEDERAAIPARLRPWLSETLVEDETGVHLPEARTVTWAFIAWNPSERA